MNEKYIVNKILKYLGSLDKCFCYKNYGFGNAGVPDIIVCLDGKFIALEVKTPKGKASELQKLIIKRINESGGIAAVVRSVNDVKNLLEGY